MKWIFKDKFDFDHRLNEASDILEKYPDKIPVIVENAKSGKLPDIDKKKFLVPYDLTIAQFHYIIRKRVQLQPETTLFCFVDNVIPAACLTMGEVYEAHKDSDKFVYFAYTDDDAFG